MVLGVWMWNHLLRVDHGTSETCHLYTDIVLSARFFSKYRYQISVACFVAMETLDPPLCGIAVKRAMQKLSECLGDELSKQEDQLLKVVLKLLQLMYSKVGYCSM